MIDIDSKLDPKVKLVFEGGDKTKKLEVVIIRTDEWEDQQYIIHFEQKNGKTCVCKVTPIGKNISTDDPGWAPGCLFTPAIDQARAIFAKYGRPDRKDRPKRKKTKVPQGQARLFSS